MSYWDESTMVFVDLYDSTLLSNEQRREFEHELAEPKLGLKLTRYQERRRLFRKPTIESAGQLVCSLPLSVQEVEIRGVVDLRMPDTQAWFFEQFVSLEQDIGLRGHLDAQTSTEVATFKYHKPRDFIDLLPTLVMPGIGGSTFHQGVGAWLRSNQVAGLVFPSARSDVYLKLLSEEGADQRRRLTFEFSGWNFVDYRDSGPADWDPLFGHLQSWVLAQKAGIEVRRHEGDGWGWEIIGAQEAEFSRVALGRDIMLGKVVAPPQWDPRGGYRRPYYQRREDLRSPGWAPFSR
jgi:hypothetical protein